MRTWLVQLKAASSSNSNDNSNSSSANSFSMSSSDLLGDGVDSPSVFELSASEVRLREDMLAALKVAVTWSLSLCRVSCLQRSSVFVSRLCAESLITALHSTHAVVRVRCQR
jgi:hypothetical protein